MITSRAMIDGHRAAAACRPTSGGAAPSSIRDASSGGAGAPEQTAGSPTDREVDRARDLLREFIERSGLSRNQVERRLLERGAGTDLGRLLRGSLDLKLRHILDICQAIELDANEFFNVAFSQATGRSPLLERLERLVAPARILPDARSSEVQGQLRELAERVSALTLAIETLAASQPGPGTAAARVER
jgi:hypothetical protein